MFQMLFSFPSNENFFFFNVECIEEKGDFRISKALFSCCHVQEINSKCQTFTILGAI